MKKKPILNNDFWKQIVKITRIENIDRKKFIINKCIESTNKNETILHVGCTDNPIFNIHTSLHYKLVLINSNIDGYDINKKDITMMQKNPKFDKSKLFYNLPSKKYKFIVAPEVIEHVNNVENFVNELINMCDNESRILFTTPNAFCNNHIKNNYDKFENNSTIFTELVHPDHNYWFSPFTLQNTLNKCFIKNKNINFSIKNYLINKDQNICSEVIITKKI